MRPRPAASAPGPHGPQQGLPASSITQGILDPTLPLPGCVRSPPGQGGRRTQRTAQAPGEQRRAVSLPRKPREREQVVWPLSAALHPQEEGTPPPDTSPHSAQGTRWPPSHPCFHFNSYNPARSIHLPVLQKGKMGSEQQLLDLPMAPAEMGTQVGPGALPRLPCVVWGPGA